MKLSTADLAALYKAAPHVFEGVRRALDVQKRQPLGTPE